MSLEACEAVLKHSRSTGSTRLVLMCLAHHSNKAHGHLSWPSVARIAMETGLSKRQVKRHFRKAECGLKELRIRYQKGHSQQNVYELLLPGLPGGDTHDTPKGSARSDTQGREGVTSTATGGVTGATQTETGTEKQISKEDPLNPPKGEEEGSNVDFWKKGIASICHQDTDTIPDRLIRTLRKKKLPPREDFAVLKRYMEAGEPEQFDPSEEAKLLRRRKQKVSTVIAHLEEMMANARRYRQLTYRPARGGGGNTPRVVAEPDFDWRAMMMDLYLESEPVNLTRKPITEKDRAEWAVRNEELRERWRTVSWASLPTSVWDDIYTERDKREAKANRYRPQSGARPPPPGWFKIALEMFVEGEPEYAEKNRARLEGMYWNDVPYRDRERIWEEYRRREAAKKKGRRERKTQKGASEGGGLAARWTHRQDAGATALRRAEARTTSGKAGRNRVPGPTYRNSRSGPECQRKAE